MAQRPTKSVIKKISTAKKISSGLTKFKLKSGNKIKNKSSR